MKSKPDIKPCWCSVLLKLISRSEISLWRRLCLSGIQCLWGLTYIRLRVKEESDPSSPGCGPRKTTRFPEHVWDGGDVCCSVCLSLVAVLLLMSIIHIFGFQTKAVCWCKLPASHRKWVFVRSLMMFLFLLLMRSSFFSTELIRFTPF